MPSLTHVLAPLGCLGLLLVACEPKSEVDLEEASSSEDALQVCAKGSTLSGIDVSEFQDSISWPSVKTAGTTFAFIRVSDGVDYPDDRFQQNWQGAMDAGITRGAYQYFRPGDDPVAQANLLLESMGTLGPNDLPPVVDVETQDGVSDATLVKNLRVWIARVEEVSGRRPIIYAALGFWDTVQGTEEFDAYPLWVANYGPSCPYLPATWSRWDFWQYTDSGSVSGVPGPVDRNRFNGTVADLQAFIAASKTTTTTSLSPVEVYWARETNGMYQLRALTSPSTQRVEYRVDGFLIGESTKTEGPNFPDSYTFKNEATARPFEVRGFDSGGVVVSRGVGLIDTVPGTAVYIKQMGKQLYEIGLERAPAAVAAIEVRADQFLLTDSVSKTSRSTRLAVRSKFNQLGSRTFKITTFNADGSVRGNLVRTMELQ